MTDSGDIALLFEDEWTIDASKPGIPAGSHAVGGSGKISLATVNPETIIRKGPGVIPCADAHCPPFPPPPPSAVDPNVGFCRAPPSPPAPPTTLNCKHCSISLTKQLSDTKCVANTTFGCAGNESMWVKGCTGMFSCCGRKIHCESLKYARHECSCDHDTPPPPPPGVASASVAVANDVVAVTADGYVSVTLDGYTESYECQLANENSARLPQRSGHGGREPPSGLAPRQLGERPARAAIDRLGRCSRQAVKRHGAANRRRPDGACSIRARQLHLQPSGQRWQRAV